MNDFDSPVTKEVNLSSEKLTKKGSLTQCGVAHLTPTEEAVLALSVEPEFLTPQQIATRRGVKVHAIWKVQRALRKKGALTKTNKRVNFSRPTAKPTTKIKPNLIRLHGQEFNIKILYQPSKYQKTVEKSNTIFLDGHTIMLYKNSIEVYAGEGQSFFAEKAQKAFSDSLKYWNSFFVKLEDQLNLILVKPRCQNIRLVNQHFARINSKLQEHSVNEDYKVKIYGKEDGKLWFVADDSYGLAEDETVHPKTSKNDREVVDKHLNDWRDNSPPVNSELSAAILETNKSIQTVSAEVGVFSKESAEYGKHIKSHIGAIKELGAGVNKLTELLERLEAKL